MSSTPTTVRLTDEQQDRLRKMCDVQEVSQTEIIREALDYLWEGLREDAEALAQARAEIAKGETR